MEDFEDHVAYLIDEGMSEEEARAQAMADTFGGDAGDYGTGDVEGDEGEW